MKKIVLSILLMYVASCLFGQVTSLHENFTNCISSFPTNWQQYNVSGSDTWECTSAGQISRGTQMNGYGSGTNQDWLISPEVNLSSYTNPMLSFWCRTKYTGPFIQVLVSTNYSGSGNPNSATWTNLSAILPTSNSDVWFLSDNISLQSFKSQPLYIAFKYNSISSAAATWKIDEVNVTDGSLGLSKKFMNIGQTTIGVPSASSSFNFTMSGSITSFQLDVPLPFQISTDGLSFSNQLNYNATISGVSKTVYVRIDPTMADKVYRNEISFSLNGNTLADKVMLLGTSLPDDKTLRVYTWNMKWFGDPTLCNCDTNQSRINATQIMKDIHADIYCLQEVVNNSKIALITSALGANYQYVVSPFCSFASSPTSSSYAGGQKLAYIYNTDKIENLGTFGLLASTYPSDTSTNSGYYCFASGRFPFVMKAKLKLAGSLSDTIIISNIHAKANSDVTSYNRRECAEEKMTDSLNTLFPGKKIIVIGDYNDFLEGSSVAGISVTPYKYMLDNGFTGITLPSHFPGQTTFIGSANTLFDNVAISSSMVSTYADSSCFIFNEVEKYIPDYGNSTSDHIPVMSYYKFNFYPTGVNEEVFATHHENFRIVNPSSNILTLFLSEQSHQPLYVLITDATGKVILRKRVNEFGHSLKIECPELAPGFYFVELNNAKFREVKKWIVNGK